MVQEMNILRCYSCHMYQVHIVKKANKWQCKICNEKQSVQHVYYQGSGQDCRVQVQRLNLKKHIEKEQRLEALEKIEVVAKKQSPVVVTEKPVLAESKWTKYMIPQAGYYEIESRDVKDINLSSDYKNNVSNNTNIFQDDFTIDKKFCGGNPIDEKETERSFFSENNVFENSVPTVSTHDVTDVSIFKTALIKSFQFGDTLDEKSNFDKNGQDSISLVQKSDLPSITNNSTSYRNTTNRSSLELVDEDSCNGSSICDYNCDSVKKKQGIVIIRKHVKRCADSENVVPESQPSSSVSDCDSSDAIYKRLKLVDASSWQKKSLRDIVEFNRSNAGKNINLKANEKSFIVPNNELVLKEINNSDNIDTKETEIIKTSLRRKTIFETDCDELEEILDF